MKVCKNSYIFRQRGNAFSQCHCSHLLQAQYDPVSPQFDLDFLSHLLFLCFPLPLASDLSHLLLQHQLKSPLHCLPPVVTH